MTNRLHLNLRGSSLRELGEKRGAALREVLPEAYAQYAALFRAVGVTGEQEAAAADATATALAAWNRDALAEIEGIAAGSGVPLASVLALNARTELLALGDAGAKECSTAVVRIGGEPRSVQTWDWHIELERFWHTHEVAGVGYRFAGLTETGVVAKVSLNERGLGLHLNILGHRGDRPGGVPLHVLIAAVMRECATVDEAIALVRETPVSGSSSFTVLDETGAAALEISPERVSVLGRDDAVITRTNHFQDPAQAAGARPDPYADDSTDRLALLRAHLAAGAPRDRAELVALLASGEGEAELSCVPDMTKPVGHRSATLATVCVTPRERSIAVLDGMPTEQGTKVFRELTVGHD